MTIPCGQRGACGLDRLLCGRVISAAYVEGLGARLKVFLGSLYQLDLDMEHVEMMIYGRRDGGHLHGCKLAAQLRNHSTPRSDCGSPSTACEQPSCVAVHVCIAAGS